MRSIKDELTLRRLDGARTDAPRCLKGKPCGDRCIPRDQECRQGTGLTPLREVDKQVGKLGRRLSPTEKLALAGAGALVLTSSAAIPVYAKLSKPMRKAAQAVTRENSEALAGALANNAESVGSKLVRGAVNEATQTPGRLFREGLQRDRKARQQLNRRVAPTVQAIRKSPQYKAAQSLEPEWAKRLKRRAGIMDSTRADRRPQCGPGSKPCGTVCIPRKYDCNAGTALAQKTKNTAKAVLGSETFRVGAALGVAAALGSVGYNRLNKEAAEEQTRFWNAHRQAQNARQKQAAGGYEQGTGWGKQSRSARREAGRSSGQALVKETLGLDVNRSYSKQEIRSAFKKWARKNHPDMGGDTARFQTLSGLIDDYYRDSLQDLFSFWARGFM